MMSMDRTQENISNLEDLLVREFRTCQNLKSLIDDERNAIFDGSVDRIMDIVEQKEALLDDLEHLEEKRREILPDLADSLGLNIREPTLSDLLRRLDPDNAGRLNRLREGILALAANIRDLTHGNRALAISALQRADALQAFLLRLFEPFTGYMPPGSTQHQEMTLSWDIDHKV
jgi:flagellar biosynthesis/type III secretory pathway chaperone